MVFLSADSATHCRNSGNCSSGPGAGIAVAGTLLARKAAPGMDLCADTLFPTLAGKRISVFTAYCAATGSTGWALIGKIGKCTKRSNYQGQHQPVNFTCDFLVDGWNTGCFVRVG